MKQSEVLDLIHKETYPAVDALACNLFASFTDDNGNADIAVAVQAFAESVEDLPKPYKRIMLLMLGRLIKTFADSMMEDKRHIESLMQAADEADMHRRYTHTL